MKVVYSEMCFSKLNRISRGSEGIIYKKWNKAIKEFRPRGICGRLYIDSDMSNEEKVARYLQSKEQKIAMLKERYNKKYDIPIYDTYEYQEALFAYEMKRMRRDSLLKNFSGNKISDINDLFLLVRAGVDDLNSRGMYNYDLRIPNIYYRSGIMLFFDQDNYRIDGIEENLRTGSMIDYMKEYPDASPFQQQLFALVVFYLHLVAYDEIYKDCLKTIRNVLLRNKELPAVKEMLQVLDGQEIDIDAIMINNEEDFSYIRL